MHPVDDPLPASLAHGMIGHHLAGMANDDAAGENHDLHRLADQAPGNRVAVGVEVNDTVGTHLADQVAQLAERSTSAKRTERCSFIGEAHDRQLARRPVHAHVGDLAVPLLEMRGEGPQVAKRRPAIALRFT